MGLVWAGSLRGCLTQPSTQEACADHPPRPSLCLPQQPPVTGMEPPGQADSPPAPLPPPALGLHRSSAAGPPGGAIEPRAAARRSQTPQG